jgi:AraC-like DNA-binding protein
MTKHVDFSPTAEKFPDARLPDAPSGDRRRPISVRIGVLDSGRSVESAADPRAELIICYGGVLRLRAGRDVWFVPAKHGIWIPGGFRYEIVAQTQIEVHHLRIDLRHAERISLPGAPTVVGATPLLRGIAQRLSPGAAHPLTPAEARRLALVAFDEMARLDRPDLRVPGGRDPRLVAVMDRLVAHPQDRRGLAALARSAGTSDRTLERLFSTETGLTFGEWRRRLRFMVALERLGLGETTTAIAARLGYSTPSAFIAAFKAHFGVPPSAYRRP